MPEEKSLEGWIPEPGGDLTISRIIDMAYDYRGNTTIRKTDGTKIVGYIFNRSGNGDSQHIEYFDESGAGPFSLPYSHIENILFTGKDTAAGKSYEAWQERKRRKKAKSNLQHGPS